MAQPIRIALTVTLVVDPEVWADEYGLRGGPGRLDAAVRDDARHHVANALRSHYVDELRIARLVEVKRPAPRGSASPFRSNR